MVIVAVVVTGVLRGIVIFYDTPAIFVNRLEGGKLLAVKFR